MAKRKSNGYGKGVCYQNNDIWVVADVKSSKKLERVGFRTLVILPGIDLTDDQAAAVKDHDAVIFADSVGPDGYAEQVQPLLFGLAKSIRVEHFDSEQAQREFDDNKRSSEIETELLNIQQMDDAEYEIQRQSIAKKLGVRVSWLDEQRKVATREAECGSDEVVENLEPWPEDVDGNLLVDDIINQIERHVVLPEGASIIIAMWIVLTYCYDCFRTLAILGIVSPQKRCGKTTTLEIITGLSCRALPGSNISPAAVFRSIEKFKPTLIIDEADSFLKDNEELRGVLNSGHTRATAFVIRCNGEDNDPKSFPTWAPKAIAAIGQLPATIADRSVIIKLRRKSSDEHREKVGVRFEKKSLILRRMCLRWAIDNEDFLRSNLCEIHIQGNDRASDNLAPLATIACAIGGDWVDRFKKAIHLMMGDASEQADDLPALLLQDIKEIFETLKTERIHSANLVNLLNSIEERPWTDLKGGRGLTTNVLARFLAPFDIASKQVRIGVEKKRGYFMEHFTDAWDRYLTSQDRGCQNGTPVQINKNSRLEEKQNGTAKNVYHFEKQDKYLKIKDCTTVPLQKGGAGEHISKTGDDEVLI